jgi:hypothetical protein
MLGLVFIGRPKLNHQQTFWNSSDRAGRKSQGPAILPSMVVRVSDKIFCFASEMQLVCRNDHGQLGIRFCFKWHLLFKHATVSMVILLIIVFLYFKLAVMHQRNHFVCLYLKTWRVRFLLFPSPIPFKF